MLKDDLRKFARLYSSLAAWKKTAVKERRQRRQLAEELAIARDEAQAESEDNDRLRAEIDVLKLQVDMMQDWAARWQSTMSADEAVLVKREIDAKLPQQGGEY